MITSHRSAVLLTAILVVAAGCSSTAASPSATSPSPVAAASAPSTPTATVAPTATATATPNPTPMAVLPGEPWIVYQWIAESGNGLYLVRPDGSYGHRILEDVSGDLFHPDWSPDGQQIVFGRQTGDDAAEVWTADADGTNAKQMIGCLQVPCIRPYAAWSPDGTELAYVREDPPGVARPGLGSYVEVRNLATGKTRVVARPVPVGDEYVDSGGPRWSPDGKRLVVMVTHWTNPPTDPMLGSSIAVVDADGSDAATPRILTAPGLFGAFPDWSPDGQRIVFYTHDLGSFQDTTMAANLYVIKPDGSGLTQVTDFHENDTRATQPTWTPDGRQIIFTWVGFDASRQNTLGERHIAFIDPDGSNLRVLDGLPATHPRLRPTP